MNKLPKEPTYPKDAHEESRILSTAINQDVMINPISWDLMWPQWTWEIAEMRAKLLWVIWWNQSLSNGHITTIQIYRDIAVTSGSVPSKAMMINHLDRQNVDWWRKSDIASLAFDSLFKLWENQIRLVSWVTIGKKRFNKNPFNIRKLIYDKLENV